MMFRVKVSAIFKPFLWAHAARVHHQRMIGSSASLVSHFHTLNSTLGSGRLSELHVSGERAQTVLEVLSPYIDFSKTNHCLQELEHSIRLRKLDLDVRELLHRWNELEELKSLQKELETERVNNAKTIALIRRDKEKVEEFEKLKLRGKDLRVKLKALVKDIMIKEESAVLDYFQLPNTLYHSVGENDKILFSFFSKPCFNFEAKGHEILGKLNEELKFIDNSPTAYYLKNKLALLELACTEYFSSVFRNHGYTSHSNVDFSMGVVVEGSGINVSEIEQKAFALYSQDSHDDMNTQYLVGGGSFQAFLPYYAKQIVGNSRSLPQKLISIGRNYSPSSELNSGLFCSWQCTHVSGFVLFENTPSAKEATINETLMALLHCFTQLKIHFKVLQYAAHNLQPQESVAFGLLIYSPATETYHEVARISLYDDFISKRLLILKKVTNDSARFLSMMHVQVCNVTHLLALLTENGQNESGSYNIPDALQKFMFI